MRSLQSIPQAVRRWLTHPVDELALWQQWLRHVIDLFRFCVLELIANKAPQMAAALAYRTIFSLVPLLVISVSLFSAFNLDSMRERLQNEFTRFLNLNALELRVAAEEAVEGVAVAGDAGSQASGESDPTEVNVEAFLNGFIERAANVNYAGIGGVGLIVLVWAALALLVTIEDSFNTICKAPSGRSWPMRIILYWALLTLGPLLLSASLYMSTMAMSLAQEWSGHAGLRWLIAWFNQIAALGATWLLLVLLFLLMPNASVALWAAALGAAVGAVLFGIAKWAFGWYVANAVGFSSIYGTLGLIPLFLIWVYLIWWIVLLGLQVAVTAQAIPTKGLHIEERESHRRGVPGPGWALPVLTLIARRFAHGDSTSRESIRRRLELPGPFLDQMLASLEAAKLIRPVGGSDGKPDERRGGPWYVLARPAESIRLTEAMRAAEASAAPVEQAQTPARHRLRVFFERLEQASEDRLADLVSESETDREREG